MIHKNLCLAVVLLLYVNATFAWTHGWDTAADAQFIDFGYGIISDEQAKFVASNYKIVSLEKCTGRPTEAGIKTVANKLKSFNPNLKVLFYISATNDALDCYSAYDVFMAHPEWWLRTAAGVPINSTSYNYIPYPDWRVAAFRNWWVTIPYAGINQPDIDGVFVDHTSGPCPNGLLNIEPGCSEWTAGKQQGLAALTAIAKANNPPGEVIGNSITMYTNPGFPADNGLSYLNYSDGAMAEHVASFELLSAGKIKPELLQQQFDRIQQAAAMGKTVVMATWPGLLVSAFNFGFPSLSGCCGTSGGLTWTGTNGPIWKQTMLQNHTWALALYLTVAEENVWMQYQLWYNGQTQGAIPCEIYPVRNPAGCPTPTEAEWYPNLYKPLGPPQGKYTKVGNIYTRNFLYATSTLNIDDPMKSTVIFHTPIPSTGIPSTEVPSTQILQTTEPTQLAQDTASPLISALLANASTAVPTDSVSTMPETSILDTNHAPESSSVAPSDQTDHAAVLEAIL